MFPTKDVGSGFNHATNEKVLSSNRARHGGLEIGFAGRAGGPLAPSIDLVVRSNYRHHPTSTQKRPVCQSTCLHENALIGKFMFNEPLLFCKRKTDLVKI